MVRDISIRLRKSSGLKPTSSFAGIGTAWQVTPESEVMTGNDSGYQVLQGEIKSLHTKKTYIYYVKNTSAAADTAGGVAMLQAALGKAGVVHSVQEATDEGDLVDGFVMEVGGKTVCGSFWKATFREGDQVHVIGFERGEVFEAIAVAKPAERLIWMRPHCERGTHSQTVVLIKRCAWLLIFMFLGIMAFTLHEESPIWFGLLSFVVISFIALFFTVGMSWGYFMAFSRQMNAVGDALGLPESEKIDLFQSTISERKAGRPALPLGVYYY
jgi:hypothetical protein